MYNTTYLINMRYILYYLAKANKIIVNTTAYKTGYSYLASLVYKNNLLLIENCF